MPCKLDHSDSDVIPQFLCVACHPEQVLTPEARQALDEADREKRHAADEAIRRKQELLRAKARVHSIKQRYRNGVPTGVDAEVVAGLESKIARLEGPQQEIVNKRRKGKTQ